MLTIIEDTAQKKGEHEIKHSHFEQMGVQIIRNKLPYGDYILSPSVSVDTKRNMEEIANNISKDHVRFKNECIKAKNAGCKLIILVENTYGIKSVDDVHTWINPDLIYRPKAITGQRLEKAMKTMTERYGVEFKFCTPEDSAKMIIKLLGGDVDE